MDEFDYKEWLDLDNFHSYVETEPLLLRATPPGKPPEKQKKKPPADPGKKIPPTSKWREIVSFCTPMVIALCVAGLLRAFVFTNTKVPTGSMENTIAIGSRLIGSKLSYLFRNPERFDIVIFKYPDDETQEYVKRIIGLPGEKVEIKNGKVYINDSTEPLRDDFVTVSLPTGNYGPYYVPGDSYFMMGDSRQNSEDSRYWRNPYVKRSKLIAKVQFQYHPKIEKIE